MKLDDMHIISLNVVERGGFKFKVSSNNYDGAVLIFAQSDIFNYAAFKSFSSAREGREWIDNMVDSTKALCRYILESQ